jgi:hypothetical protein
MLVDLVRAGRVRSEVVEAVRGSFARGVSDEAAEAMLEFVVVGEVADAARELARAIEPKGVEHYQALIRRHVFDALAEARELGEALVLVGRSEAAAAELLTCIRALALELGQKAREIVRQDELELDREVAEIEHGCGWRR